MIPPRPWRVDSYGGTTWIRCATDREPIAGVAEVYDGPDVADLIVRLVNAEPEIVAALEYAITFLTTESEPRPEATGRIVNADRLRAALAKVRP